MPARLALRLRPLTLPRRLVSSPCGERGRYVCSPSTDSRVKGSACSSATSNSRGTNLGSAIGERELIGMHLGRWDGVISQASFA